MHLLQALLVHVGIHLGGGEGRVAQQLLHHPEVGAAGHEMGCEGMSEGVW